MPTKSAPTPVAQLNRAIKVLLESIYRDGIDTILSADIGDNQAIEGKFRDGRQVYDFSISGEGKVSYIETEENGTRGDSYLSGYYCLPVFGSQPYEQSYLSQALSRTDNNSRKRQCEKGKSCGATCIAKGIRCNAQLPAKLKQALPKVQKAVEAGKEGDWKKVAAILAAAGLGLAVVGAGVAIASGGKSGGGNGAPQPPNNPESPNERDSTKNTVNHADLSMVVPGSAVKDLKEGDEITIEDLKALINEAPYFYAASVEDSDSVNKELNLTDDKEVERGDSPLEFYVRIGIGGEEGKEMIGQKLGYALKTRIPASGKHVVKRIAFMKNFSGLENFTRI